MNWWTWTPIRGQHFGRTFSTYVWTDLIHHPIRDTFRTAEPTFQFNVNLTMRLNKTIKTHRQDQFKSCDGSLQPLYQPSITSLGTPLNSHQKLCVNSILHDCNSLWTLTYTEWRKGPSWVGKQSTGITSRGLVSSYLLWCFLLERVQQLESADWDNNPRKKNTE